MRRYRHEIDNVRAHLRSLWAVIGLQALIIVALWIGWSRAPKDLVIHVRPDLRSGAVMAVDEVPPAQVYAFAFYIFQQLNRWPEDGAVDYGRAIFSVSPYLTPKYREALIADLEFKGRNGELAYRVRGVQEIAGHGYQERRVDIPEEGVWVVWLDRELFESVKGMTVKRTAIRYPLRVVRYADRKKNAHMLILGPTGAGKSALLVYLLQQMAAVYRPRIFIIEAGGSFSLLGQHFQAHGLSVHRVTLNPNTEVSLPPFADALRLLDKDRPVRTTGDPEAIADDEEDDTDEAGSGRDLLGEMEIAARIMITGGDEREDARMTRADRLLIRNAIFLAARTVRDEGRDPVLTEDVVAALQAIGRDPQLPEHRRSRAIEMADGMALFCSGLAGHFFNRPGSRWPEADVTLLEMGLLAREGYEDQLTVAYLSMMSHINDLVERRQQDARQTLVVTDEGHIITTNPLLARYVVKITKMWRKLGAWFWIATQNLEDFPDASRRMLNMMEWWLCLVMPKEEVEQIARFKDLTDEQRSLLLSTRKEPGKYVEGVVLSDKLEALFRSVPPPLSLALAMTEKHEKAEWAQIMREQGCSELEAAHVVAGRIAARGGGQDNKDSSRIAARSV